MTSKGRQAPTSQRRSIRKTREQRVCLSPAPLPLLATYTPRRKQMHKQNRVQAEGGASLWNRAFRLERRANGRIDPETVTHLPGVEPLLLFSQHKPIAVVNQRPCQIWRGHGTLKSKQGTRKILTFGWKYNGNFYRLFASFCKFTE
jgi:hypothetical protein